MATEENHLRGMMPRSHADDMASASALLDQAIELHAAHMAGEAPTTAASQKKLMRLLEKTRDALSAPPMDTAIGAMADEGMMAGMAR